MLIFSHFLPKYAYSCYAYKKKKLVYLTLSPRLLLLSAGLVTTRNQLPWVTFHSLLRLIIYDYSVENDSVASVIKYEIKYIYQ